MDTEKIQTFMGITGASETVAFQKLEQNHGDLNEAVNAYFNERDRPTSESNTATHSYIPPHDSDEMDIDNPTELGFPNLGFPNPGFPEPGFQFPLPSLLSPHGTLDPFSLLDRHFPELNPTFQNPRVSNQPRVSREIPIEVKDGNAPAGPSNPAGPVIEEITDSEIPHLGTEVRSDPTVIIDEPDDINNGSERLLVGSFGFPWTRCL